MLILNVIYFIFLFIIICIVLFLAFIIYNIWTKSYNPQNTFYIIIPLLIFLILSISLTVVNFLNLVEPLKNFNLYSPSNETQNLGGFGSY